MSWHARVSLDDEPEPSLLTDEAAKVVETVQGVTLTGPATLEHLSSGSSGIWLEISGAGEPTTTR